MTVGGSQECGCESSRTGNVSVRRGKRNRAVEIHPCRSANLATVLVPRFTVARRDGYSPRHGTGRSHHCESRSPAAGVCCASSDTIAYVADAFSRQAYKIRALQSENATALIASINIGGELRLLPHEFSDVNAHFLKLFSNYLFQTAR